MKKINLKNEFERNYPSFGFILENLGDLARTKIGEVLISKGADINAKDIIYLNVKILFLINVIENR